MLYYGTTTWTPWGQKQAGVLFEERQRFFDALRILSTVILTVMSVVQHLNDSESNKLSSTFTIASNVRIILWMPF